jgi:hypothetical protein
MTHGKFFEPQQYIDGTVLKTVLIASAGGPILEIALTVQTVT